MFKERVLTALVLAPIMIGGIFFLEDKPFALFIAAIATIGAWEWANIAGYQKNWSRIAYAFAVFVCLYISARFLRVRPEYLVYYLAVGTLWWVVAFALVKRYPGGTDMWTARPIRALLGLCVLVPMWVGFMHLKTQPHSSLLIIYVMLIVWGADTGAYFAGKQWGKAKLAPHVSPGKSWAGFWGGLVTTIVIALIFGFCIDRWLQPMDGSDVIRLLFITVITMVISVLGDLVESMMKRHRGIKDSSSLLPGHGGVLDRIDSMAAAVPVFAFCMMLLGWGLVK
ncbi:MAG: phosphatidate cytidylyltransferase [Oceanospirillaceae bacterium]|uniref:phosphatidate cytidylyltransferase n=1 Tax=unclassified Thalassolituus TaxID=2624967 RepID=UPI000C65849B|nr:MULTISPECIES: phosphatidate cytidylyltransferase [unclassified Thalassolituus]MAX99698.1 phosphatidate cytidylyltransferase [Oceanospirillaceae bacterium]MBL35211.1 phosphatidate cytidylyltransferase [Oceanospirillaceae bacterium]MBS54037.1 phosphatidate cytidylyltransferase [Oceanospirillaceae bacterium]